MKSIFKIRRISDSLFSAGGPFPTFDKSGKIWKSIGAVKCHIKLVRSYYSRIRYDNTEVIEYMPVEVNTVSMEQFLPEGNK